MTLDWLDFDCSEDTDEGGTFDAMASVCPEQLPLVLDEIDAVLKLARDHFGPERPLDHGGDCDVDLQAWCETQPVHSLTVNLHTPELVVSEEAPGEERVRRTVTLSLCGSVTFAEAMRERFAL